MSDVTATNMAVIDKAESRADVDDEPKSSKFWLREIEAAGKRDTDWHQRAREVVKRYRDERNNAAESRQEKRANILWSNTELLKSALFQGIGNPDVRRRFPKRGQDEKNTKTAALVMERAAAYLNDAYDCDTQIAACVEDMVLPGRGVAWVVYDATVVKNEETGQDEVTEQTLRDQHVFWEDFRSSAGREESDIWWKARGHHYSRDELREYFPDHGDKVPLNAQIQDVAKDNKNDDDDTYKRSRVWEIWDKTSRTRVWVAEGYEWILKSEKDPYKLTGFFPCPPALYGVKTTSSLEPIPEFTLYQDQANELDEIATRLTFLVSALKRRGVYDAGLDGENQTLGQLALAGDNVFLPMKGFSSLLEKGGLKNAFQTEDLQPIVAAIEGLYKRAAFLIQQIYEITGIADVMRGASDPNETLGAQELKANFGSLRLRMRQKQVQRFIRELLRIKTEIVAEHFTREHLQEMTGIDMPLQAEKQAAQQQLAALQQQMQMAQQQQPMPGAQLPQPPDPAMVQKLQAILKAPSWEEIAAILRSDQRRGYKIDVETDQTAQIDEAQEKASRIEFMSTISALVEKTLPLAMQMPAMRPLVKESVMFVVKAFKAGRPMEEAFDEAFSQLEQMPPPQQQGDPVQAAKAKQIEVQTQATMQDAQIKAQQAQVDNQIKQQQIQTDQAGKVIDLQAKQLEAKQKADLAVLEHKLKEREAAFQMAREIEKAEMDRAMDQANAELAEFTNRIEAAEAVENLRAKRAQRLGAQ